MERRSETCDGLDSLRFDILDQCPVDRARRRSAQRQRLGKVAGGQRCEPGKAAQHARDRSTASEHQCRATRRRRQVHERDGHRRGRVDRSGIGTQGCNGVGFLGVKVRAFAPNALTSALTFLTVPESRRSRPSRRSAAAQRSAARLVSLPPKPRQLRGTGVKLARVRDYKKSTVPS